MPTLNNWSLTREQDPYLAPEVRRLVLQGHVYEHPDFEDGTRIVTSPIVTQAGNQVVTTSGTHYILGPVSLAYEAQFPNARERLLAAIAKAAS